MGRWVITFFVAMGIIQRETAWAALRHRRWIWGHRGMVIVLGRRARYASWMQKYQRQQSAKWYYIQGKPQKQSEREMLNAWGGS